MFKIELIQWFQFGNEHFCRTRHTKLPFIPVVGMELDAEMVTKVQWWSDVAEFSVRLEETGLELDYEGTIDEIKAALTAEGWEIEGCRIDDPLPEICRD